LTLRQRQRPQTGTDRRSLFFCLPRGPSRRLTISAATGRIDGVSDLADISGKHGVNGPGRTNLRYGYVQGKRAC